eukprot:CAMPEP_0172743284 /NCGR_PEP_ID=MMETSP1074-20121228/131824_1 /TAXON_ID=2916 /ORGANISM="Ceratium fusus, Strain PA161109" /LENGTH=136 /DNA_ID=CAMNT_0013573991 /DNA_START=543 /DNA_END=954 /DNA_ORIENTATION=-
MSTAMKARSRAWTGWKNMSCASLCTRKAGDRPSTAAILFTTTLSRAVSLNMQHGLTQATTVFAGIRAQRYCSACILPVMYEMPTSCPSSGRVWLTYTTRCTPASAAASISALTLVKAGHSLPAAFSAAVKGDAPNM